jgi:uncharacterized protein (DUF58 family)
MHRLTEPALRAIHTRMKAMADVARLPLRSGRWSGVAGSMLGQGTGSSIDFQDQRPYLPGDDPRHINWQAYARTGNFTMKLYREEVSPRVDVLFDTSESMFLTEAKAQRTWELVYFCLESALRLGASLKIMALGAQTAEVQVERALAGDWPLSSDAPNALPALLNRVPLRSGSLRVLISDLLSTAPPDEVLAQISTSRGHALVLAPFCNEEAAPDWSGNIEFEDAESAQKDKRRVEPDTLTRYLRAYQTHFALWREQCTRHGGAMGRVSSDAEFLKALRAEAVGAGVVEM